MMGNPMRSIGMTEGASVASRPMVVVGLLLASLASAGLEPLSAAESRAATVQAEPKAGVTRQSLDRQGRPAAKRTYRIATTEWIAWSPLDVARVKGFWKEEGLSVELVHYYGGPVLIEVIRSGKVDFSANMVGDVIGMHMQGIDMTILAEVDWSHGGDQIIVRKGTSLARYRNRPIAIHYDSPAIWFFMHRYLSGRGLRLADYRLVELEPDDLVAQFVAGRVAVIQHYEPYAFRAVSEGNGQVVATSADYEGVIPECLYAAKGRLEQIPASDVRKIIRGWIRAAQWISEPRNWPEYTRILNDQTFRGHRPYSDRELRKMFEDVRIHDRQTLLSRNRDGGGLSVHLTEVRRFLSESGRLRRDYDVRQIFDNRFILDVLEPANR